MDIKKAYSLRKFIIEVENKLKAYNQTREELIRKYGEEIDGQTRVTEKNIPAFMSDISKLHEEEIEIEIPEIEIDDLN